ncbi:MAG: hypothetical protein IMW85_03220 [Thermicanus sp.]|nr:hypothetical protein [Thermicanus sp.]
MDRSVKKWRIISLLLLSAILFILGGCSLAEFIPKETAQSSFTQGWENRTDSSATATDGTRSEANLLLERSFIPSAKNLSSLLQKAPLYRLSLEPQTDKKSVRGEMVLSYVNRTGKEIKQLDFVLYVNDGAITKKTNQPVKISEVKVNGSPAEHNLEGTLLNIPLKKPLQEKEEVQVSIAYEAALPEIPEDGGMMSSESLMSQLNMMFDQRTEEEKEGDMSTHYGGFFGYQGDLMILGYAYPILIPPNSEEKPPTRLPSMGDISRFEASNYLVTVKIPSDTTVASSGVLIDKKEENGVKTLLYQGTGMRDFILALSPSFETFTEKAGEHEIEVYTPKELKENGENLLQYSRDALTTFEELFGTLPYKKISVVVSPIYGAAGGMEFSGLVIIDDSLFKKEETTVDAASDNSGKDSGNASKEAGRSDGLEALLGEILGNSTSGGPQGSNGESQNGTIEDILGGLIHGSSNGDPKKENGSGNNNLSGLDALLGGLLGGASGDGSVDLNALLGAMPDMEQMMALMPEMVVAHELAHQWWYSLVGSRSLEAPWLDESITQYSGFIALERSKGVKARDDFLKNSKMTVNVIGMFGNGNQPITLPLKKYSELAYAALIYEKGALFYHELRQLVGDEAFFSGLKEYAAKNLFQLAPLEGPIPYIKEKAKNKEEVEALVNQWLRGN